MQIKAKETSPLLYDNKVVDKFMVSLYYHHFLDFVVYTFQPFSTAFKILFDDTLINKKKYPKILPVAGNSGDMHKGHHPRSDKGVRRNVTNGLFVLCIKFQKV